MAYNTLKTEIADNILIVTINRPDKMNALNLELLGELKLVINDATVNPEVKGVILTGEGEKAFAAGADIAEFASFTDAQGKEMAAKGHDIFNSIEQCPKPWIAAVNGFALGGGCELAMACHIRVASENARFGQPEVNLGVIPGYGGTQRLIQLIGKGKALELLMTADMVKAPEALNLGLVNHVVPLDELMDKTKEIHGKIQTKGPLAIAKVIECVNAYYDKNENSFLKEIELFGASFATDDFKEGTTAFVEKRGAAFKGK